MFLHINLLAAREFHECCLFPSANIYNDSTMTTEIIIAFLTLAVLEIVLGVDNLIFISLACQRLPAHLQARAWRIGLALALVMRLLLLSLLAFLVKFDAGLFSVREFEVSIRDLVLLAGGIFLIYKATMEIHQKTVGVEPQVKTGSATFFSVIGQIVILDFVFSFDSILTAVGLTDQLAVMAAAIITAIVVMMALAKQVSSFFRRYPTVQMLALAFLMLIGFSLTAEGLHFHIPKGYIYFAVLFSMVVEALNLRIRPSGTENAPEA